MKFSRNIILPVILCLSLLCAFIGGCLFKSDKTYRHLIPKGYIGWVRVDFNIKDAPALPKENEYFLVKIPHSGILKTSDDLIPFVKYQKEEYYYYSNNKRYPLDIGKELGGGGTVGKVGQDGNYTEISLRFWVGTQKDYDKYQKGKELKYGPWKKLPR